MQKCLMFKLGCWMSNPKSLNTSKICSFVPVLTLQMNSLLSLGRSSLSLQISLHRMTMIWGLFTATEHTIDTGDAKPIKQWMRRVPLGFADEEEKYLNKMLDNGVIIPSNSEWASPSVLIHKKDGTVRWCIDF